MTTPNPWRSHPGADQATYDHIGSTAVPDLAAYPYLDLQVRILPLPSQDHLDHRLTPLGFARAEGSGPDSPGVTRDTPRGGEHVSTTFRTHSLPGRKLATAGEPGGGRDAPRADRRSRFGTIDLLLRARVPSAACELAASPPLGQRRLEALRV